MTSNTEKTDLQPALSLTFAEVGRLRVRPAEFARMVDVSRQTVSQWIAQGKVTLGADGRLDPTVAAGQVVRNSDPTRLRARVLKSAVLDGDTLRRRIAGLERDLAAARERIEYLEKLTDDWTVAEELLLAELAREDTLEALLGLADRPTRLRSLEAMRDRAAVQAEGLDLDLPDLDLPDLGARGDGGEGGIDGV